MQDLATAATAAVIPCPPLLFQAALALPGCGRSWEAGQKLYLGSGGAGEAHKAQARAQLQQLLPVAGLLAAQLLVHLLHRVKGSGVCGFAVILAAIVCAREAHHPDGLEAPAMFCRPAKCPTHSLQSSQAWRAACKQIKPMNPGR